MEREIKVDLSHVLLEGVCLECLGRIWVEADRPKLEQVCEKVASKHIASWGKGCPYGGQHEEQPEREVSIYPYEGGNVCCKKCGSNMRHIPWSGSY